MKLYAGLTREKKPKGETSPSLDSESQQQPLAEASTQLPENLETLITVVTTAVMTAISASLPNLVNAAQNANCEKKC